MSAGYAQTFHGYPCTEDCSGHEAGYNWGREHDIDAPEDCSGNSNSFIEGCQAYATEHQQELQENDPNEPSDQDQTDNPDEGADEE
jgi:hypothetical protein